MTNVDSGLNVLNPAASASTITSNNLSPASQTPQIKTPQPDLNSDGGTKSAIAEMGASAAERKFEAMQHLEKSMHELKEIANRLNEAVASKSINLHFSVDEESKRFVIEVRDSDTGELIRQIPGDTALRTGPSLELMRGVLFDETF